MFTRNAPRTYHGAKQRAFGSPFGEGETHWMRSTCSSCGKARIEMHTGKTPKGTEQQKNEQTKMQKKVSEPRILMS